LWDDRDETPGWTAVVVLREPVSLAVVSQPSSQQGKQ